MGTCLFLSDISIPTKWRELGFFLVWTGGTYTCGCNYNNKRQNASKKPEMKKQGKNKIKNHSF